VLQKVFVLICLCLLLQACASQRDEFRLNEGKQSFIDGDYKKSFHDLLPLASQGNAHAEYAVGYMYYYGYGVAQDSESGLFWMQKSATQGYDPAKKALDLINHHNQETPVNKALAY
jgi:TPR repeat protein